MNARPAALDRLLSHVAANLPGEHLTHVDAEADCSTCEHYLPASPAEEQCNPDGCGCTGYPAACDIQAAPAGATFPITNCPRWAPTNDALSWST
ncbi:hypothetical protein ACWEQC_21865 [Streptomyces shenzhenensis]